ncbi:hypothetical protein DPMN_094532 [Dreissena polymorpha]|uniref:Uncharacterized protein n=1 Tax=Dreissena polymorpha TaxID=45954 RepID=A0A9D4L679_DREPO|nr:hypothetical protein DPMN_094532 [Dreissena polymorpha]
MIKRTRKLKESGVGSLRFETRAEQKFLGLIRRLDRAQNAVLRGITAEEDLLTAKLESYGAGMTKLSSYFTKKKTDVNTNVIWFPLERSSSDWEPKPCCIGVSSSTKECVHFPCRNLTSYHFMFRELPQWLLDVADDSVKRSKQRENLPKIFSSVNTASSFECQKSVEKNPRLDNVFRKPWQQTDTVKLPELDLPIGITPNERRLKITIAKKRLQNELENKPVERCVNYGKPMSVRQLQRPVRTVARRLDVKYQNAL